MRIGIDVDGVLAAFEQGFAPLLTAQTGVVFPRLGQADWPDTWNWGLAHGISEGEVGRAWNTLKTNPVFWAALPPYADTEFALCQLYSRQVFHDDEIYFITNRMGVRVKSQTETWLDRYGFPHPTVLISGHKGLCAQALHLHTYIDDKPENCLQVSTMSKTRVFLMDRPWNQAFNNMLQGIPRVKSLPEMFQLYTL